MPSSIAAAVRTLDQAIPTSKAASWDAVGLQVGDLDANCETVAVCHEVTDEVVGSARDAGVDLLISYHPLLLSPARTFVSGASPGGRAHRLATDGISLYVVHTAYDVAAGGCADALADAIGLEDPVGFGPNWPPDSAKIVTFVPESSLAVVTGAMAGAGGGDIGGYSECSFAVAGTGSYRPGAGTDPSAGTIGELSHDPEMRVEMIAPAGKVDAVVAALVEAHPYDEAAFDVFSARSNAGFVGRIGGFAGTLGELRDRLGEALRTPVKMAGRAATPVERVAVVPGSGASMIGAAAAAGADVLVTGDVSHHRANEALNRGVFVLDAGHAATERPGIARLYSLVSRLFDGAVDLTHLDPSPWEAD